MATPSSVIDFNMVTKEKVVKKEQQVLGGKFNKENYIEKRVWTVAEDGTEVPMSMVYHKDTKLDGSAPLLQYAYGSYGSTMDPYFSTVRLSLLDRGFIYVIAHIRGGEDLGREWYEEGKLLEKKNTFTDFIDCSKYLIAEKYTSPEHLYAEGGSAGGLLMGAVMNMAPELYNGMIAQVPFVDVKDLLVAGGVIGIVIGFGAQSIIRDFLYGFFFLFEGQFKKGDFVIINDSQEGGVVEDLGFRAVKVRLFNGKLLTMSNGEIKKIQCKFIRGKKIWQLLFQRLVSLMTIYGTSGVLLYVHSSLMQTRATSSMTS